MQNLAHRACFDAREKIAPSKPEIKGTDDGIWGGLKLVPFEVQIPKAEQIPKDALDARLWAERDGIFAWAVRGLLDFLEGGLQERAKNDAVPHLLSAFAGEAGEDICPIREASCLPAAAGLLYFCKSVQALAACWRGRGGRGSNLRKGCHARKDGKLRWRKNISRHV